MMAPDPLDNNRNWVRAAMGLKYLKEGLEGFVENEIINLHSSFLRDIRSSHGLPPTATCHQCTLKVVLSGKCQNKLCDKIAVKIVNQHRFTQRNPNGRAKNNNAPCWKNTDVTQWCSSPWEIAKCFMANGYSGKMSAKETDCTGILSVLINCLYLQNNLATRIDENKNDIISKMRETRNNIMHSSNLEVTDAELQQYIDGMIDILDDSKTIQAHPDAVTARTKLTEIKTNTFIISSRDELELRKKAIEAIEHKQKELLEQCQQQQADLQSKLDQTLTSLTQAESASQQKQADLQAKVDQTLTSLTQAESASQQQQADIQSKLDQTLTSLTQAESASQQKQADLQSKVDQTLTSLTQTESASQQKHADLQAKVDQTLTLLTQAEDASQQQQTDLKSKLDQEMNTLSHNQAICQQNQKDLQSKCDQTMTSLTQAERQCQQKQDDIQSSQCQLYIKINSLQTQMTQVLEVLKKCQLDIDHVRSDLQKGTDKHEEHVKILEHKLRDRQLLQTRLREKYMYQSTIPLSPIMKNMKVDINKVYQNLVIRPDLIHDPNVNTQTDFYFNTIETKTAINGYRDIFFNNGEPCKNIFVVGNGGVGKTTWCLKLLSSWLNCETNDKDKDVLQRFKYVFYVQLRHTKQASQINDMIRSYLFSDEQHLINSVNDVLLNEPEHCLVLLDGLDEWKLLSEQRINDMGLPHDPMHSKYTTLITSRPWKLEILRLEPTVIDKAVEVKGLDKYGIHRLAGHIIDQLNCVHKKNKELEMFNKCISTRKMPMIEVPLMLSIFVYLWYENDFIGETFAGLYGKLTVNLFETAEGNAKRIRQNLEVSKLENIKDIIEKRKERTSEITMPIPDCLKDLGKSYIPILYSLGKLSFDGLLSKHSETFLVFTQNSIKDYMTEEELEVALYIGILSQTQTIGDRTVERFSISFVHKTIQEFFAAVYIVLETVHDEKVSIKCKLLKHCEQIQNVFEIENVLIIICGMDPKLAGELTRQISIMHKKNTITLERYRITDDERLHETLISCVREEHLYLNESNHVYIVNHVIQPGTLRRENQNQLNTETLSYVHINQSRIPMCLYINLKDEYSYIRDVEEDKKAKSEYEDAICKGLSGVHTLKKLVIYGRMVSLYNDKICLRISECINHLECQTLELKDITGNLGHIDLTNNTELTDLTLTYIQLEELSLPHDGCLQNVELNYFEHPQGDSGRLTLDMNNQPYLEDLELDDITGNIGHINLSNNSKLTHLNMTSLQIEGISLPHDGCLDTINLKYFKHPDGDQGRLTLNMNNQLCLKYLTLVDINGNNGHIYLSNNSKLKTLNLTSLRIEEISLPQDGCLETINLNCIKHPQGDQGKLTLNMNNQQHLKNLELDDITGNVGHINVSNNSKLTKLTMTYLQIEELSLPQYGCLETLELKSLKHPQGDHGRLTLNMNNQPCLEHLTLANITGNVGHINLSKNSKLTQLIMTSLKIEEISLPQDGWLETVELQSLKHPQGDQGRLTLNMNNQPCLKHLILEDITGNVGHINLSNSSKLTYLPMKYLQIEEISLPQNGCLQSVELKSIKHPQGDQGSLTLNMNNQPILKNLTLQDITGNVGHINLSKNSKLTHLIMRSLQIEEISLPLEGCLKINELKSIKHPQGDQGRLTLNMNNQPCLEHLTLADITGNVGHINLSKNSKLTQLIMTSLKIEEISLPQDGWLETVELQSLKHPQGDQGRLTLNMNNQPCLKHLILEDITGNVGHINLSNSSKLTHLIMRSLQIEEISLPLEGCLKINELKSIKHPQGDQGRLTLNMNNQPCLEHLTLADITGNVGHINLSKNSKLTQLIMTSLKIEEISLPQDGWLETVELQSLKHPQGDQGRLTLNMNNQPCLEHLTLADITGNVGHINLSKNSKLTQLIMTSLKIEEISLPQDGWLETVELQSLKHPQGDQGRLTLDMNNQPCLKHLILEDITGNVGHINLSNSSKLTYLPMKYLQIEEISLPQNGCLQSVELKSIKHPQGDQGSLTLNMNNQPILENLTLQDITGNVGHINLSKNSKLTHLIMRSLQIEEISLPLEGCLKINELKSIKHPQGDQGSLTINMINVPHLKYLTLEDITGNVGHINLSNNSKLTHLIMRSLQIEEISLPLEGCLFNVYLKSIKHPHGDQGILTLNMNNQPCLNYMTLDDMTGNVGHINMSNDPQLKSLNMTSLQTKYISLPQNGCLEIVELQSIKHPQGDQGRLTLNMNNQPCLKHLELEDITGNVGHINLSNNSELTELTMASLQIEELSLPHNGCLETLELESIKHPHGDRGRLTFNMDNQPRLNYLKFKDITGNVGHIKLSNNIELQYLSLTSLQIEEITLPQDKCLWRVELKSIKHPQGDQGRLIPNIDNQPYLEYLTLEDITGNIGHINLSNNSQLTSLTLTSLQIEEVSLPQEGCLQRVYLQSIKHPKGDQGRLTLDLNNQPCLKHLTLKDIPGNVGHINLSSNSNLTNLTMTSLHIEQISIPQNVCLQSVELKSIKHPQGDQ